MLNERANARNPGKARGVPAQAADEPLAEDVEDEDAADEEEAADDFESDPVDEEDEDEESAEAEPEPLVEDDAGELLDEELRLSFR